jgi:peptidoglycan/xylan/chitin deacetylase (PgdA/CDA1 family)
MPVNTPQQIIAMAEAGIEIGAHTRHHADLGQIADEATLRDEIAGSKQDLEALLGRSVRYFAFPYGTARQLTAPAIQVCREAGFEAICSAVGGYNFPGDDPFHLQRIHGDCELPRFYNWATMDPRKLKPQLELPNEVDSKEFGRGEGSQSGRTQDLAPLPSRG